MSSEFFGIEFGEQRTSAKLSIDTKVYSKSAVLRASYWFSRDLWFKFDQGNEILSVTVGLKVNRPTLSQPTVRNIEEMVQDLLNALVDSQLRVEIQAETTGVRELIIAKAFAEAGILEDSPPGTFEDPVAETQGGSKNLVRIDTEIKE